MRGLEEPDAEKAINAAIAFGELARFTGLGTTASLGQAAMVAKAQGAVELTARCLGRLGDIALRRSDHDTARQRYEEALVLYERIPEQYSIGSTHRRLARLGSEDKRHLHVDAAKKAWQSIGRSDLVAELMEEFGRK